MKHLRKQIADKNDIINSLESTDNLESSFNKIKNTMLNFVEQSRRETDELESSIEEYLKMLESAVEDNDIDRIKIKMRSIVKHFEARGNINLKVATLFEMDSRDYINELKQAFKESWKMIS